MRIATALVLATFLAGCVASPTQPTTSEPNPPSTHTASTGETTATGPTPAGTIQFVLFEARYYVNRTGSGTAYGDLGHHCGEASYDVRGPNVTFIRWGSASPTSSAPPPKATLVRQYIGGQSEPPPVQYTGTGATHHDFDPREGSVAMKSAFDPSVTLFQLTAQDDVVRVNGTALPVGASWTGRVETTKSQPQGDGTTSRFDFTELLTVKNWGEARLSVVDRGHQCI